MSQTLGTEYHDRVAKYYDQDAEWGFKDRANENPLLNRIRNDFRKHTVKYEFSSVLEIGVGPGFDVTWFAEQYPNADVKGVDVSQKMLEITNQAIQEKGLKNCEVSRLAEHELIPAFGAESFDLIYVYFGALNTTPDLHKTAEIIRKLLKANGKAVLTFVNKYYMREALVQALKLNPKGALARFGKNWGGYSNTRHLPSHCYSAKQIEQAFSDFHIFEKKGYSIYYPAWYNFKKFVGQEERLEKLWQKDKNLQDSWLWDKGEYVLYAFEKP